MARHCAQVAGTDCEGGGNSTSARRVREGSVAHLSLGPVQVLYAGAAAYDRLQGSVLGGFEQAERPHLSVEEVIAIAMTSRSSQP